MTLLTCNKIAADRRKNVRLTCGWSQVSTVGSLPFPARFAVGLFHFAFHWLPVIYVYLLIGCCDYFSSAKIRSILRGWDERPKQLTMIANSINVGLPVSSETIYLLNSFVSFLLLPILPKYALWESSGRSQRQVNFFQDLWLGFSN